MAWDNSWAPQYVFSYGPSYKTSITEFDSGKEQRRQKWASPRHRFHLVYNAITKAQADLMVAEFDANKGAYTSFSWTNPADTTSYTVRFVEDTLMQEFITSTVCRLEFDLLEVI